MADDTTRLLLEVLGQDRGASRMLNGVAGAAENAADAVDDLDGATANVGKTSEDTAKKARTLDERIEHQRKTILDLAKAIEDGPDDLPLFKTLSKEQSTLRKLERVKALLPNEKDGEESGEQVSKGFFRRMIANAGQMGERIATSAVQRIPSALGGALSALPPQAQVAIVGGIVAAIVAGSSFIGAALSGAITAGLGAATIAGGVALAAKDTRVLAAASSLGQTIMGQLSEAAGVFVGPVLKSLEIVRAGWKSVRVEVMNAFAAVAPYVDNLTGGIVRAIQRMMPGLVNAIQRSGPLINALGNGIARMGAAIGQFFNDVSSNSAGAQQALHDLFTFINATIVITGKLLAGLTKVYEGASFVGRILGGDFKGAVTSLVDRHAEAAKETDDFADYLRTLQTESAGAAQKLSAGGNVIGSLAAGLEPAIERTDIMKLSMMAAAQAAGDLAAALKVVNGDALNAREAESNYQAAIDGATAAIKENGKTLDLNTEKGRANDAALRALIDATFAKADADYKARAATGDLAGAQAAANADLAVGRQKFIELATAMTGSSAKARELADKIYQIPKNWPVAVSANTSEALAAIARVQKSLGALKDRHVGVYYDIHGNLQLPTGKQIKGSATGGPVEGPGPRGVDSLLRVLAPGEHVLSASDVDAMGGQRAVAQFRRSLHSSSAPPAPGRAAASTGPTILEAHIEIGGEVVRVTRSEIREHDRMQRRLAQAGSGSR